MEKTSPTKKGLYYPKLEDIQNAKNNIKGIIGATPTLLNLNYSEEFESNIYFKREDLQIVRSYKIRGAFNKMSSLAEHEVENGVVCASAGNHAQGVAYSCQKLEIKGTIFMPAPTPKQKINQVKMFGKQYIDIVLIGDTFDDAYQAACQFSEENKAKLIHPFNDPKIIEGQGTVGLEILGEVHEPIDYLFVPIGGGGLASGVSSVFKKLSPKTKIIGVEPAGASAMKASIEKNELVKLKSINKFIDGAAVKQVGDLTFEICKQNLDSVVTVDEGKVCSTILKLYNREAIVAEPAGALTISVLDQFKKEIKGKTVVSLISGSNNDIGRMEEIKERSLLYEGLKHYFIIRFPQRTGALKEFLNDVLGPTDDITFFEYSKKSSREKGPAVVGLELRKPGDLDALISRMDQKGFKYEYLNEKEDLFQFLI